MASTQTLGSSAVTDDPSKPPPPGEVGAQNQQNYVPGWSTFIDEAEYVPELVFPSSVLTYHRMRSDTQIEALHIGTVQPVREMRWFIDPNGAKSSLVKQVASDFKLPVKGEDDNATIERSPSKFDFDTFLSDALLGPLYGFMPFEVVGDFLGDEWHMEKLSPRHPRGVSEIIPDENGELAAIRQTFAKPGPNGRRTMPPPIVASKLIDLIWRPEAGTLTGRSMLRSMYREWLVKDRVLRIAAINLERAGGVPVAVAADGASQKQIEELAILARQFKVSEGGGGALPFGSDLKLVGGSVPDAISLLKYCDEAMARVWALMLVQLGATTTGSRALGGEFALLAARAQRLMAKWVTSYVNNFLDRYTDWNEPFATHAPMLAFEPSKPEGMSVTELVSLLDAGALTVDPELETWLRTEYSLPKKPEPAKTEALGDITPAEEALIQNSRNPPALPAAGPAAPTYTQTPMPSKQLDPSVDFPTVASSTLTIPRLHRGIRAALTLPGRQLRREPSQNEIRAAVDFKSIDDAHTVGVAKLQQHYLTTVLPAQIKAIGEQVRSGAPASKLQAPVIPEEVEQIRTHLEELASNGVHGAAREAQAQGVDVLPDAVPNAVNTAADKVAKQAEDVASLNANGLSLGAQRKAGQLLAAGDDREQVATALEEHLKGQKHVYERENLKGAAQFAQNTGRIAAMDEVEPQTGTAVYEASEILDSATCGPCEAIDGTVFDDFDEAQAAYASGGYSDCEGGPNCRGTLVAVYPEQNPSSDSNPVGGDGAEPTTPEPGRALDETPPAPSPPSSASAPASVAEIETTDHATAYIRDTLGYGEIPITWGDLDVANLTNVKPGSQAEINRDNARSVIQGVTSAIQRTRSTIGEDGTALKAIVANTELGASSKLPKSAIAATRPDPIGNGVPTLIINDSRGVTDLARTNVDEATAGFISKATRDPYGWTLHEMGHVLSMNTGMRSSLPDLLRNVKLAPEGDNAKAISTYAGTNADEAWAESFATLMREGALDERLGVELDDKGRAWLEENHLALPPADDDLKAALRALRQAWNKQIPGAALPEVG